MCNCILLVLIIQVFMVLEWEAEEVSDMEHLFTYDPACQGEFIPTQTANSFTPKPGSWSLVGYKKQLCPL